MSNQLPCCEACIRNQTPILDVMTDLGVSGRLLELGSGTGQHSVYLTDHLKDLVWQPSDLSTALPDIEQWRLASGNPNLLPPIALDVTSFHEGHFDQQYDCVFSANTIHFVGESIARDFIRVAAQVLKPAGRLLVYGPFNENGTYTSEGNARLDTWLKERDPASGIKDKTWLDQAAAHYGLLPVQWHLMPANNWIAEYRR